MTYFDLYCCVRTVSLGCWLSGVSSNRPGRTISGKLKGQYREYHVFYIFFYLLIRFFLVFLGQMWFITLSSCYCELRNNDICRLRLVAGAAGLQEKVLIACNTAR